MEAAAPGQILASETVVDAGADFIELPRGRLGLRRYGEYYLRGGGATSLCEVADLRFREPAAPNLDAVEQAKSALASRLESAGYHLRGRLGDGPFGVTYKTVHAVSGKLVAVKVLHPDPHGDDAALGRVKTRVAELQALDLPGAARIIEARLDHQPPFLATEYAEGRGLDEALAGANWETIARVFKKLCETLERGRAAGVAHGDLKSGNAIIAKDGSQVILDFAVTALAARGPDILPPNPSGAAPEIIRGERPEARSDVYAAGAMLFQALAGREPFAGRDIHQVIQGHLHDDPPPPSALNHQTPDGLQRICLKALEKEPGDRYATAGRMGEDLERYLRGEVIRARPTAYDNLIFHRAGRHIEQIQHWRARQLVTPEEANRLLGAYEGLQRRGLPAAIEGNSFRLWQTLVYIGGWAVINGSLLWLTQRWGSLGRLEKLALGSAPALTALALAATMWRIERFRLFFVAAIVAVAATPLIAGVWLYEFGVAGTPRRDALALELFHRAQDSTEVTNRQLLLAAGATLAAAGAAAFISRAAAHSGEAVLALAGLYTTFLLENGLRPMVERGDWATVALQCAPLLAATIWAGAKLLRDAGRGQQAPPWVYFSAILFVAISSVVAWDGPAQWSPLAPESRQPLSWLLLSVAGGAQVAAGLAARGWLRHHCRPATYFVVVAGLLALFTGLAAAGWKQTWPANWPRATVFGQAVPWPHVVLPVVALGVALLSCRHQMAVFLLAGMAGLALSIHSLGHLYFHAAPAWPKALIILGAAGFFTALWRELRRARGNAIEDVARQSRL